GVLRGEQVKIGLADHIRRAAHANPVGQRLADAQKTAVAVLEINMGRHRVEETVEQVALSIELRVRAVTSLAPPATGRRLDQAELLFDQGGQVAKQPHLPLSEGARLVVFEAQHADRAAVNGPEGVAGVEANARARLDERVVMESLVKGRVRDDQGGRAENGVPAEGGVPA